MLARLKARGIAVGKVAAAKPQEAEVHSIPVAMADAVPGPATALPAPPALPGDHLSHHLQASQNGGTTARIDCCAVMHT